MKKITAIKGAKFFTGSKIINQPFLVFQGEKQLGLYDSLAEFPQAKVYDFENKYCLPGFVDLQVNGGGGTYFVKDRSQVGIREIANTYRKYGTTSFLPTLVSTRLDRIFEAIESTRQAMLDPASGVLGMHLEGPYLNPEKRGAHLVNYLRKPVQSELEQLIKAGGEVIKLLTIAPELFTPEQMELLRTSGMALSAGHSNANYTQAKRGFEQGISKVTHLYKAMSGLKHRDPGLVGATFDSPDIYAGIIADGIHLHWAALNTAFRLKKGKLFFVTDSVFVDHPEPSFAFDGFNIRLKNGAYVNEEGNLAGAAMTMQEAIFNSIKYAGIPELEAFKMATSIPAEYLGLSNKIGHLRPGAFADLVILNEEYQIERVFFRGELVEA